MTELDNFAEKTNLLTRNLQEVIGQDLIKGCFEKTGTINLYWGTAPTGRPHIAYFLPMTKIADFLKAGLHVTILFADLHAYLDNMKAPWELLQKRTEYYELLIKGMLRSLKVPLDKLRFIRGTDYQLNDNYAKSVYQIFGITSVRDAAKAGCEVVKQVSDPLLSGIVYPLLQALDEEFLEVDVQFGGVDQRKIFMYAEKYNPALSFAKRAHLMNPMIPGLTGGKMSASEENSKIDLLDNQETVLRKLQGANCEGKTAETNGMLAFLKYIALPIKDQFDNTLLNKYISCKEMERDFGNGTLTEKDLKEMVGTILCSLMSSLREEFVMANKESLIAEAYPSVVVETNNDNSEDKHSTSMSHFPQELEALNIQFPQMLNLPSDKFPGVVERPRALWSCRVGGEPHIGYLIPLRKLAALSNKNWKVVILIEDIGAYLHSKYNQNKPTWDILPARAQLYSDMCRAAFDVFGGNKDNMEIVLGSEFQLSKKYTMLMYQSLSKVTENECNQIMEKMVGDKPEITANLSSVIYPCISVLDQLHLRATVRLFGERQYPEELESFDRTLSDRLGLGHHMPLYVSHENLVALDGKNVMSSPKMGPKTAPKDTTSISMCDSIDVINRKMKKAFFDPKTLISDPTIDMIEKIIWPQLQGAAFSVTRTAENGGDVSFMAVDSIKEQLVGDVIHPGDIKVAASQHLFDQLLAQIHRRMSKDCASLYTAAFPEEAKKVKINKKAFNPNKMDLRVAVVKKIVYVNGSYHITLKTGLNEGILTKKSLCQLSPGDYCLVLIKSSSAENMTPAIGILTNENGYALRLARRPYRDVVSFKNHETVVPNMKETNNELIIKELEANCVVIDEHVKWLADGSLAHELVTVSKCMEPTKIRVNYS